MTDRSTCMSPACGITVEGNFTKCPECGWAMRGPHNIRVRGWVLIGLGLFLVLLMGWITWAIAPSMLAAGKEVDGMTYTGTSEQTELAIAIFGMVIVFGLLSLANGIYMVVNGRQNRVFTIICLVIAAILFAIGWAIRRKLIG